MPARTCGGADRRFYLSSRVQPWNRPHAVQQPHRWMGASGKQNRRVSWHFSVSHHKAECFCARVDIPCVLSRKYSPMSLQQWLRFFGKLISGTESALSSLMWTIWFCIFVSIHKITLLYHHCKGPTQLMRTVMVFSCQVLPAYTELGFPKPGHAVILWNYPFPPQWHLLLLHK